MGDAKIKTWCALLHPAREVHDSFFTHEIVEREKVVSIGHGDTLSLSLLQATFFLDKKIDGGDDSPCGIIAAP